MRQRRSPAASRGPVKQKALRGALMAGGYRGRVGRDTAYDGGTSSESCARKAAARSAPGSWMVAIRLAIRGVITSR